MNKTDIQNICDSVHKKILADNYKSESLKKRIASFSSDGKMSLEDSTVFVLSESQKFTVKMIQDVLIELLTADTKPSESLSTDI